MVRAPMFDKNGVKKGAWSQEEDDKLRAYVEKYGHWNWRELPKYAGLSRCGKSCRLRWMNYLRPGVKHGNYSGEEEDMIIKLHERFGNKWSRIAAELPGRTDNEIKNHWHTNLKKRTKKIHKSSEMEEQCKNTVKKNEKSLSNSILESHPLSPDSYSSELTHWTTDSAMVVSSTSSDLIAENSNASLECGTSLDDFWTQPFVADQDGYKFPSLDEGIASPYVTYYEHSVDLFYQVMQELSGI